MLDKNYKIISKFGFDLNLSDVYKEAEENEKYILGIKNKDKIFHYVIIHKGKTTDIDSAIDLYKMLKDKGYMVTGTISEIIGVNYPKNPGGTGFVYSIPFELKSAQVQEYQRQIQKIKEKIEIIKNL